MSQNENKKSNKTIDLIADRVIDLLKILWTAFLETIKEFAMRAKRGCLPWTWLLAASGFAVWYVVIHKRLAPFFYIKYRAFHVLWVLSIATLPVLGYSFIEAVRRKRKEAQIQSAFTLSGLTNPLGRMIRIIGIEPIDKFTTRVALTNVSQSIQELQKLREKLGTNLKAHVEEFRESRTKGILELILSVGEIPVRVKIENYLGFGAAEVLIGESRSGKKIYLNFDQYPHLLVAGTSGGGKSSFLRHLITLLYLNSTNEEFLLVDLKAEAEFNTFGGLPRTQVHDDPHTVVDPVSRLAELIDKRMRVFKANEVADINAYFEIAAAKRKPGPTNEKVSMARTYLIVDEAAELFLASSKYDPQKVRKVKEDISAIARKGRAAGIHLILSLQKPEVRAIDAQIKSCMTTVLCFPMLTDADSISALGVGRATDLSRTIKGRAIWKLGNEMPEVQVPWLSKEKAKKLLLPYRIKEEPAVEPANSQGTDASKTDDGVEKRKAWK